MKHIIVDQKNKLIILTLLIFFSSEAIANSYIGPGLALGTALITILIVLLILFIIIAVVYYPLKKIFLRIFKKKK